MDCQTPSEDIIVVAPRLPEAAGEDVFARVSIDAAAIADAVRLDSALRVAPGVSLFRRNDSGAANPTIQGLSVRAIAPSGTGRALVTLDGQPMNDPFGGWVIWGALPSETIEGADIVRGAGAGPYGAGALTGAVRLRERRGQGAALTAEAGDLGYARLAGVGEAHSDAVSLMLAASAQVSDGWVAVRDGRGLADVPLASDSMAGVARAEWRGDDLVFAARLGAYSEWRSAGLVGAESRSEGSSLSVTLADPLGPFAWRVQAWAMQSDLYNSSVAVAPDRSTTTPANVQFETPALGWGGNAAVRWSGDWGGVEVGADLRAADGETRELFSFMGGAFTRSRIAGGRTLTAGAYVEGWRVLGDWLVSGGARVDVTRAEDGSRVERFLATGAPTLQFAPEDTETVAPTARFGVRRGFGEHYVRGAAYAGFRPPTLNELHRPFRVGNDVTEANALLEPERLTGVDAGVGGDYAAWSWRVGVFAARLEDAIVNVTLGAGPGNFPPGVFVPAGGAYRQRQNAGLIEAAGLEADVHGALGNALTWRAAVAFTEASFDGGALDGLRPAQAPKWSASASLAWRPMETTTVSADVRYESARFEDDLNTRTLGGAAVIDLRLEQDVGRGVSLYAALDNAGDAAVETSETADGIESFAPPSAFRVGVRLRTGR